MKSYVALTSAAVIAFGLYTATKASYLSTKFSTVVAERNLIYLAPLLFIATGLALERGRLRLWAIAGTAGFVLYVILTTPYQLRSGPTRTRSASRSSRWRTAIWRWTTATSPGCSSSS